MPINPLYQTVETRSPRQKRGHSIHKAKDAIKNRMKTSQNGVTEAREYLMTTKDEPQRRETKTRERSAFLDVLTCNSSSPDYA